MPRDDGGQWPAERTNVATPRLVVAMSTPLLERKFFVGSLFVCASAVSVCVTLASLGVVLLWY